MCGLSAYYSSGNTPINVVRDFQRLFLQSAVRGLHAFGLVWSNGAGEAPGVLRSFRKEEILEKIDWLTLAATPRWMLGHTRYSTSGDWRVLENNQPLVTPVGVMVFNGIISQGTKAEYEREFGVQCAVDNDGEILLRKIEQGVKPEEFVSTIQGSYAGFHVVNGAVHALRNARRPLWLRATDGAMLLASTKDIFERAGLWTGSGVRALFQLQPGIDYNLELGAQVYAPKPAEVHPPAFHWLPEDWSPVK